MGWSYFRGSFLYGAGLFSVSLLSGAGHILVFNQYSRQIKEIATHHATINQTKKATKKSQYCQTDRRQQPLKHSIREKSVAWFSVCCRLYRPDCKGSLHCSMNCCRSVFGKPLSWYSWIWTRKYTHYTKTKIGKLILHPCGQSFFFLCPVYSGLYHIQIWTGLDLNSPLCNDLPVYSPPARLPFLKTVSLQDCLTGTTS